MSATVTQVPGCVLATSEHGIVAQGNGPHVRIRSPRGRSEWWAITEAILHPNGRMSFLGYRYQPTKATVTGMRPHWVHATRVLEVKPSQRSHRLDRDNDPYCVCGGLWVYFEGTMGSTLFPELPGVYGCEAQGHADAAEHNRYRDSNDRPIH